MTEKIYISPIASKTVDAKLQALLDALDMPLSEEMLLMLPSVDYYLAWSIRMCCPRTVFNRRLSSSVGCPRAFISIL